MGKKKTQVMKEQESSSFLAAEKQPIASPASEVSGIQVKREVPVITVPEIDPKTIANNLRDLFLSRLYKKLECLVDNLIREPMDQDDKILVLYKLNKLIDSYNPDNFVKAINILIMKRKENLNDAEYLKRVLEVEEYERRNC